MTFKKDFFIKGEIRQARIYSTAFGIYELELNGKKMGNDYFAPGYTSYKHQLQYQMYDITEELRKQNQLVAVVGGGWAAAALYLQKNEPDLCKTPGISWRNPHTL